MNIFDSPVSEITISELFHLLSQPFRLQILTVIGEQEACVCHLETALGLRQAYISQQLMILRDAGLVTTHKDGRNVYYQLANPAVMDIVRQAAVFLGSASWDTVFAQPGPVAKCPCPHCSEAACLETSQAKEICCDGEGKS